VCAGGDKANRKARDVGLCYVPHALGSLQPTIFDGVNSHFAVCVSKINAAAGRGTAVAGGLVLNHAELAAVTGRGYGAVE
jgi:hypothetical protein